MSVQVYAYACPLMTLISKIQGVLTVHNMSSNRKDFVSSEIRKILAAFDHDAFVLNGRGRLLGLVVGNPKHLTIFSTS